MSVVNAFMNSKDFSKLIMKGKDQSYLTPEDINDAIAWADGLNAAANSWSHRERPTTATVTP